MNVLFLTTGNMDSFQTHSIYPDLLREFIRNGHKVYAVSALEKRHGKSTVCKNEGGSFILRVKTGNLTKCRMIEKGISILRIQSQFRRAIDRCFSGVHFDLIIYSTPPITLSGVIRYYKERDNAKTYLLLKDIFPQNAVDIGVLSKTGIKSVLYRFFRNKEKKLYEISDMIGCMSRANVEYVLKNNPEISSQKVEICPNCIEIIDFKISDSEKQELRKKYGLPNDKKIFLYGGNLGKPQGIGFMLECLSMCQSWDSYFLIVGDGTDFGLIRSFIEEKKPKNIRLERRLDKDDFDRMTAACDVGLIFLDHRFTIPNFPSRLLTYMQAKIPVAAFTDANTDVGEVIRDGGFGWWESSDDPSAASKLIDSVSERNDLPEMGRKGYEYLRKNYAVSVAYNAILNSLKI